MDEAKFHRHHDDHAEPDRVEAEMGDHRKDDRHRQNDHGHRVHQAAEHQIHHHHEGEDAVAAETEAGEKFRDLLRGLRHREEISEDQGADQHREHRRGGTGRLQQRGEDLVLVQSSGEHADQERAGSTNAARLRRGEARQEWQPVKPANDKYEQQRRRPDIPEARKPLAP